MNPSSSALSLQELLRGVEIADFTGDWHTEITSVRDDSRRVLAGSAFFAVRGHKSDGALFVEDAVARGAAAVIADTPRGERHSPVAWVRVHDVRKAFAAAAANLHRHPEQALRLAAVTGTNGKTTTTTLLRWLLANDNSRWGLIGTIRHELGERIIPAQHTTPAAGELYHLLAQMRDARCEGAVLELSSHAIDQDRAAGLQLEALAFTNLTRDHLDYHRDIESYFLVKSRPFLGDGLAPPKTAVINTDDPYGCRLAAMLPAEVRRVTFGTTQRAIVRAEDITLTPVGSTFTLVTPECQTTVNTRLPGHYNVSNILCALALARALGRDPAALAAQVENFPGVPGRMERVALPDAGALPFQIFVDYAHTDDALKNALSMLRPITPNRLLVVFGCGGDRDRGKRPAMTRIVQKLADQAWATSDNPRRESQQQIFDDMRTGVINPQKITFIEDRRQAISTALDAAGAGDTLLIAGKGHENYQIIGDTTFPFDDRRTTRELLQLKTRRGPV